MPSFLFVELSCYHLRNLHHRGKELIFTSATDLPRHYVFPPYRVKAEGLYYTVTDCRKVDHRRFWRLETEPRTNSCQQLTGEGMARNQPLDRIDHAQR